MFRHARLSLVGLVALVAAVAGLTAGVAWAAPAIHIDTSPGSGAPPATLGGATMTKFAADGRATLTMVSSVPSPLGGSVGFSPSLEHRKVSDGTWATWSNGYTGDVYFSGFSGTTATLSMPTGTSAFYFYAEPEAFAVFNVTATAQDGTTTTVSVNGNGGAKYFGFYATGGDRVSSITVSTPAAANGFAVGEFGIASDTDLALAQPSNVTVDATSPTGAVVTYTNPAATDENLATVTVNCVPPSGSTFAIGDTTVTCTATDTDGDANSPVQKTFNVHVKGAAEQLVDLFNAVQGVGPGTSLADKIASIQADLASGDTSDACGTLNAFIHEVKAQTGKSIPAGTAASLIASAQQIEAVIGC
jgi:hypothetical protein